MEGHKLSKYLSSLIYFKEHQQTIIIYVIRFITIVGHSLRWYGFILGIQNMNPVQDSERWTLDARQWRDNLHVDSGQCWTLDTRLWNHIPNMVMHASQFRTLLALAEGYGTKLEIPIGL
jgi:hypothetical protein